MSDEKFELNCEKCYQIIQSALNSTMQIDWGEDTNANEVIPHVSRSVFEAFVEFLIRVFRASGELEGKSKTEEVAIVLEFLSQQADEELRLFLQKN